MIATMTRYIEFRIANWNPNKRSRGKGGHSSTAYASVAGRLNSDAGVVAFMCHAACLAPDIGLFPMSVASPALVPDMILLVCVPRTSSVCRKVKLGNIRDEGRRER